MQIITGQTAQQELQHRDATANCRVSSTKPLYSCVCVCVHLCLSIFKPGIPFTSGTEIAATVCI